MGLLLGILREARIAPAPSTQHGGKKIANGPDLYRVYLRLRSQLRRARSQLQEKLTSRLGRDAAGLEDLVKEAFEEAGDLGGRDSELQLLRSSSGYVKPVRRLIGTCPDSKEGFHAYDSPLDKEICFLRDMG